MNVLVLMAGEGERFKKRGYNMPKPYIKVRGRPIVEWTTRSLPFINHYGEDPTNNRIRLSLAVREEHVKEYRVDSLLREIYGNPRIIQFSETTRGNLETAYICATQILSDDEFLVLDSDNYYDGSHLKDFISANRRFQSIVCCFKLKKPDPKWCYVLSSGKQAIQLLEKDESAFHMGGRPIIGVFYFRRKSLFIKSAEEVLRSEEPVKGEYYMSQAVQKLIDLSVPVGVYEPPLVMPLGTPEDVKRFEEG